MPEIYDTDEAVSKDSSEDNMNDFKDVSVLLESLQMLDEIVLTEKKLFEFICIYGLSVRG